jgi:hypothetical protein
VFSIAYDDTKINDGEKENFLMDMIHRDTKKDKPMGKLEIKRLIVIPQYELDKYEDRRIYERLPIRYGLKHIKPHINNLQSLTVEKLSKLSDANAKD